MVTIVTILINFTSIGRLRSSSISLSTCFFYRKLEETLFFVIKVDVEAKRNSNMAYCYIDIGLRARPNYGVVKYNQSNISVNYNYNHNSNFYLHEFNK